VTVHLVGAGPGDPGLLTVRGRALLAEADAVVYDRLVDLRLLEIVPPAAELIDAGKRPGGSISQAQINAILIDRGRRLRTVVRLKGGDPFVFGRGGEEAEALAAAGVAFEVVPGVSAATAVPAYAGVPVTHRGLAASFTVVTGHGASGDGSAGASLAALDWEALARLGGTLVLLMAVAPRASIAARLMAAGRAGDTPVLVVENGTLAGQRSTRTTLDRLAGTAVSPPATIVIGEVAALDLAWYESGPLAGRSVVVTRTREQASELSAGLAALGATPIEMATIAVAEAGDGGAALREAVARLSSYDWVVLTSANSVERLFGALTDARALAGVRVAAIGAGTAAALSAHGVAADLVPQGYVGEALVEAFRPLGGGGRVLLPRAAVARDVVPDGLREIGFEVDVVEAYRTVRPELSPALLASVAAADAVTFTASSTVTGFLELAGLARIPPVVACIGPITAATARQAGVKVDAVAEEHSIAGLLAALVSLFEEEPIAARR
jgi:uroporphyrinogen III methyltransferase / synthase